jgi:hypothetical protein
MATPKPRYRCETFIPGSPKQNTIGEFENLIVNQSRRRAPKPSSIT